MAFMEQLETKADAFGFSGEFDRPRWITGFPCVKLSNTEAQTLMRYAAKAHVDYLLSRSWFNRVWVVQVILAAEIIVSCGRASMGWTKFARAVEVLRGAYRNIAVVEE
ncbi:hypothetical protein BDV96DRAFT_655564 [Lophiotrema nucula]|uniref:Heterokaryon incompatibility domain-containing protein n=1 Tax=Lophiotrema nucula TaxID=690887 RepID=A0A6A5YFJ7_9PLEO|nr:hypothetical protein BDV96DRAFT_655564 [Lophiotrema nucula]